MTLKYSTTKKIYVERVVHFRIDFQNNLKYARMMKLVTITDLKSVGSNSLSVRVRLWAFL